MAEIMGYEREKGKAGIRNLIAVIYTVDCARTMAYKIANGFKNARVIGFPGCFSNILAYNELLSLGIHPNVGAVLIIAFGCECTDYKRLLKDIEKSGRDAILLIISKLGSKATFEIGRSYLKEMSIKLEDTPRIRLEIKDLIIGVECGGSDSTSGLVSNPAVGRTVDIIISQGGMVIVEEFPELLGCKQILANKASNEQIKTLLTKKLEKAKQYALKTGIYSISLGNFDGGLTTIEEKSLGATCKLGTSKIVGVLERNEIPPHSGLYMLDTLDSLDDKWLFPNQYNDTMGNTALLASHSHIIIFTTGTGNIIGSAFSPVIKVTGNPKTYQIMHDNIDINAGGIITEDLNLDEVAQKIYDKVLKVAAGEKTKSELMEHFESFITYHF